jgi:hypothetical protein
MSAFAAMIGRQRDGKYQYGRVCFPAIDLSLR